MRRKTERNKLKKDHPGKRNRRGWKREKVRKTG